MSIKDGGGKLSTGRANTEGTTLWGKFSSTAGTTRPGSLTPSRNQSTSIITSTGSNFISPMRDVTNLPNSLCRSITYFRNKRELIKNCITSLIQCFSANDPRPYAEVSICSTSIKGLLDSGASVSVLGKGSLEFLKSISKSYHKLSSSIKTADGSLNTILGYIWLPVTFGGKTKEVKFCIVPTLEAPLYLGIDFWEIFNILPRIDIIDGPLETRQEISNKHVLTTGEALELKRIIALFPSSSKEGLGKTTLHEHNIEVTSGCQPIKQRDTGGAF